MSQAILNQLTIGIKGAGDMASAVAWRLYMANFKKIFMMEIPYPLAVRRGVCFCEAVHEGQKTIEGVQALKASSFEEIRKIWDKGKIAVVVDPEWKTLQKLQPDVLVDAILAKKNIGTKKSEATLVLGLGPGFCAGDDVHMAIETKRGHYLGRIITSGKPIPDTGIPGNIGGYTAERLLRAPAEGVFEARHDIGDIVKSGEVIANVGGAGLVAGIDGVIRGLIRPGTKVTKNMKVGDIDPRSDIGYCDTISDKAMAIAGSVIEAVMRTYNK
ncbi:MAG: EF2563 family selenium-dependent molybdenum hydroxylase system protein [Proteobacteria bacterium]|nr:EF2563 family selenium-dependent molybdenum hydroxylase system protein [Pseudomonadota bacterium]